METNTELKNGKYVGEMIAYKGTQRRINVFQGKASIYTMQGHYITDLSVDVVQKEYKNISAPPKTLYNVVWLVGGEIKDYIKQNVSYPLARHFKNKLMNEARYQGGLVTTMPSNLS